MLNNYKQRCVTGGWIRPGSFAATVVTVAELAALHCVAEEVVATRCDLQVSRRRPGVAGVSTGFLREGGVGQGGVGRRAKVVREGRDKEFGHETAQ